MAKDDVSLLFLRRSHNFRWLRVHRRKLTSNRVFPSCFSVSFATVYWYFTRSVDGKKIFNRDLVMLVGEILEVGIFTIDTKKAYKMLYEKEH